MTASPCIQVCVINQETGWCYGCYRTLQEITQWTKMTSDEQSALKDLLDVRAADPRAQVAPQPAD
ncbi:MAG: DUF1289 domain-containing protein [Sphingomonadales bacterium]